MSIKIPDNAGDVIRKKREALGLNQKIFSEIMGVNQPGLSEIENGKQKPSRSFWAYFRYRYIDSDNCGTVGEPPSTYGKENFEDKEKAAEAGQILAELEKIDSREFYEAVGYIKNALHNAKIRQKKENK